MRHNRARIFTHLITMPLFRQATGTRLGNITQAVFTLILGMGLAFYLSWQLALAALPFVPLCVLGTYIESRQMSGNMAKEKSDQESGNQVSWLASW